MGEWQKWESPAVEVKGCQQSLHPLKGRHNLSNRFDLIVTFLRARGINNPYTHRWFRTMFGTFEPLGTIFRTFDLPYRVGTSCKQTLRGGRANQTGKLIPVPPIAAKPFGNRSICDGMGVSLSRGEVFIHRRSRVCVILRMPMTVEPVRPLLNCFQNGKSWQRDGMPAVEQFIIGREMNGTPSVLKDDEVVFRPPCIDEDERSAVMGFIAVGWRPGS